VVGAGAAGLWAAEVAARAGRSVLLLEKTPRTGTKVLASGGTHCNLTTTLDARRAAALFGRAGERFLRTAFRLLPPAAVRKRFESWGVPTVEAAWEKVFPASGRALDVRDALEHAARSAGVEVVTDARVAGVEPLGGDGTGRGGWRVTLADGDALCFQRLVLAPGGRSYPRTGTTGDGYAWLAALGLELVEPLPALVPLVTDEPWVHALTGIAVQEAEVRLYDARRRLVARRERPVLFTHRGLSGPGPMDLSVHVARAAREHAGSAEHTLAVDLLPRRSRDELTAVLREAGTTRGAAAVHELAAPELPRRLFAAVCRLAELASDAPRVGELDRASRHRLVEALKGLAIPIRGTLGFDRAEVTAGGLALDELDAGSLRVRRYEGLHVCGEVLDLQGPIGGLNFQAAFATAEAAARSAASR